MLLATTFCYCLASAVLPVLPAELWVAGLAAYGVTGGSVPWYVLAAASGQMVGKSAIFLAARETIGSRWLHRRSAGARRPGRWRDRVERWVRLGDEHAWAGRLLCLVSAFSGLPPFLAVSVALGPTRMRLATFVALGLAGRYARFGLILISPAAVERLW